ncbi:MAG: putative DNA-binding domain-containing protein [Rhizobiaceae bacterium]|nr:putative DNA-binding domain-containing protein [Rhizobiaceae bacterium]
MPDSGHESAFSTAIRDPYVPTPGGVISAFGGVPAKRFDVYRNNVTVSLVKALAEIFPAVSRIVGEQRFADLARLFVRENPPKSPLLFRYGREFPAFIESFAPARSMPYLADVARLERAWLDAFHAADAAPLSPQSLAAIPPDNLPIARFVAHPAAALTRSPFAAVTIFHTNREERTGQRIDAGIAENGLVTRPGHDVVVRSVPAGTAAFLNALLTDDTLAEAASKATAEDAEFDLSAAIGLMLESGVFAAIESG